MPRKVTIRDISRASGTSASTVSRVLTGSARVSRTKREAVERAMQRLNYRPSAIARSLKTKTTHTVSLLLNDITNPFYSAIARGVEEEANREGYSLILCNTNEDAEREEQYLEVMQSKRVDGIILGPSGQNEDYICELAQHTPLVQIDRQIACVNAAAVLVDNEESAYRATRLLLEKGHQRIGVALWQKRIATMAQRHAGYARALAEAGLSVDPNLVVTSTVIAVEHAAQLISDLLQSDSTPTALFAFNNQIGISVLLAAQRLGLRIPADLAVIVFDDLPIFELFTPSITVIKQPAFEIGVEAMRLLVKQMRGSEDFSPEVKILPTELIQRASV